MSFLYPEKYYDRISQIDIDKELISRGYNYVLLDVDNTILTRDTSIIPDDVQNWLNLAISKGIRFCLVSNDWHTNVVNVSKKLNLRLVRRSLKPLPPAFIRGKRILKSNNKNTIMIGDQLMTDVIGAHFIGMKCILVKPLVKKDLKHTLILRKIENIILRNF